MQPLQAGFGLPGKQPKGSSLLGYCCVTSQNASFCGCQLGFAPQVPAAGLKGPAMQICGPKQLAAAAGVPFRKGLHASPLAPGTPGGSKPEGVPTRPKASHCGVGSTIMRLAARATCAGFAGSKGVLGVPRPRQ